MEMKVSEIAKAVELVARDWRHSPYYEKYDNPAGLIGFWGEKSEFRESFEKLDLTSVIELACGHGRHAAQIVDRCGQLILMDVDAACIEFCRTRIKTHAHVSFHVNSGADFQPVSDESVTAIFSYDAMVHFEPEVVFSYLADAARVLRQGGRALLHHSNYDKNPGSYYRENPHWRNFMNAQTFTHFARRAGLAVEEMRIFSWGEGPSNLNIDALSLLRKA